MGPTWCTALCCSERLPADQAGRTEDSFVHPQMNEHLGRYVVCGCPFLGVVHKLNLIGPEVRDAFSSQRSERFELFNRIRGGFGCRLQSLDTRFINDALRIG